MFLLQRSYLEEIQPITVSMTYLSESSGFSYSEMSYVTTRKYKISSTGGYGSIKYKYELYKSSTTTTVAQTTDFTTNTNYSISTESISFSGENYVLKITAKDEYGNISTYKFLVGDLSVISKSSENTGHNYNASVSNKTCKTLAKVTYTCIHCDHSYTEEIQDINISLLFKGTAQTTINGYGTYSRNYEIIASGGYGTLQYKGELYSTPTSTSSIGTFGFSTDSGFSVSTNGYSFVAGDKVVKITVKDSYGNSSKATFKISDESRLSYEVLDAEHGNIEWIVTQQPTCTECGMRNQVCSECGEVLSTENISETGHTESEWIIDNQPTCTEKGTMHKECLSCKVALSESDIAAIGHSYTSIVVPPTKTQDGYTIYSCHCGDSYKDNYTVLVYSDLFTTMEKGQEIFCIKPQNVPLNSNIILLCYNNKIFAGMSNIEYNGETLIELPIAEKISYDTVKLLIWSNLTSLKPIADVQTVSIKENNTITFKTDENTDFQIQNKYINIPVIVSGDEPTKDGYEFKGWSTEIDGDIVYKAGDVYNTNKDLALYAVFVPISYTVSYDANGGINEPVSQEKNHDDTIYITETIPQREGFSFVGWSNSLSGEILYYPNDEYSNNSDITLYAIWKENSYEISYNTNGGIGNIQTQTKMHTEDLTLTTTIPTREGYDFLGWSDTAIGDVVYKSGEIYTKNSNITLYAVWEVKKYTISYNANGGENIPETQAKIYNEDLTLSSLIPTKTGYNFKGWSTSVDDEVVYISGDKYTNNSDITLYAVWEEIAYVITYNVNGGDSSIPSQYKPYWSSVNLTTIKPTRQGYTFKGWSTTLNDTISYSGGELYSTNSDITLYAVWEAHSYTISYYVAYADGDIPNSQTKLHDVDIMLDSVPPFKNGCQFAGWATSRNGDVVYQPGDIYSLNENINLFDVWTYNIEYDANGGTNPPETQTFVYNGYSNSVTLSNIIPTREGYTFIGWSTSPDDWDDLYNPEQQYTEGKNLKLYAVWQKSVYTIGENLIWQFSDDGVLTISGIGEMSNYAEQEKLYPWLQYNREQIQSIVIEEGVTSIAASAFDGCINLSSVSIPNTVTNIGRYAFSNTGIQKIVLPHSITTIGEAAFSNCQKLKKIDLSENLTIIEPYLFSNCTSLSEIIIGDTVTSIGENAFSMCTSLVYVKLGENVSHIGNCAFSGCSSLSSIELNENLAHVSSYAFASCVSLTEINIKANKLYVEEYAFYDCGSVTKINMASIEKWLNINFASADANLLNLTEGKLYINDELLTKLVIPDGIIVIPANTFVGSNITELQIPNTVTEISTNAFKGCYALTNVVIPDNVIIIGESAFESCYNLTTLDIGNGVENIGKKAFYNDSSLQTIIFGKGVKNIGYQAFLFTFPANKYYRGSDSDWANVTIEGGNTNATSITQYSYTE